MNLKKAKYLRKQVYGDMSLRQERTYEMFGKTRVCTGLRREYQLAKKRI